MASAINPLTGSASSTTAASTSATGGLSAPPTEQMFLNLLVAQMQNQDPLNPTDSTQFVSQLAQFSELEQVIAIRQDLDNAAAQQAAAATAAATAAAANPSTGATSTTTGTTSTAG